MQTYNFPMVHIKNLANFKASLLLSDRISCRVYDIKGSVTNRCLNNSIYNLIIKQDIVYDDLSVELAAHETAPAGAPRFALSYGTYKNKVRGLYFDNPDLDNPWAIDQWEKEEVVLLWGLTTTSQRAVPKQFPVTLFDNLEYCELLILFNGGYVAIREGMDTLDDDSRKNIARLHDALTMLTGR